MNDCMQGHNKWTELRCRKQSLGQKKNLFENRLDGMKLVTEMKENKRK